LLLRRWPPAGLAAPIECSIGINVAHQPSGLEQVVIGERVFSRIVPAVTLVWCRHRGHTRRRADLV
jgi:hypothetical protein